MPRTIIIPPGTVFKSVSPPQASDIVVKGPIKLLTGDDVVTVRPLSGGGFRKLDHRGCDLDELLRVEDDGDLGALDGDDHPRGTLFARLLRCIKGDGSRINLATAVGTHLPAEGDQLETGLHRGERRHDQAVRLAPRHAPDADVVVVHADGRKSVFRDQAKHFIRSLIALRWIRSSTKDARGGEEAQ